MSKINCSGIGKCRLSYNDCMVRRHVDIVENMRELGLLEKLAVSPLFTLHSPDRINPFMTTRVGLGR